ncbi:MAG: DUF4398 domain-containing protein [Deltaproteobacteria bacterium]|nr:MAG: DUF4398 domain-containing protein [Deltaproteobacteria bacterium]
MNRAAVLPICTLLLAAAGCSVPKPPPELIAAQRRVALFERERELRLPPHLVVEARRNLDEAEAARKRGDIEMATHYAILARIRADTAQVFAETARIEEEIKRHTLRLNKASLTVNEATLELERIEREIAQVEKILAARARAAASEALGKAREALYSAEGAAAPRHVPESYERARKNLSEAEIAFEQGAFDRARILAENVRQDAIEAMNRALDIVAREVQAKKTNARQTILDRLAHLPVGEVTLTERGIEISLPATALFAPDSDELLPTSAALLDPIASICIDFPEAPLLVEGYHTEADGFEENFLISGKRARRVKRYFVEEHHIAGDRITADGFGESGGKSRILLILIVPEA